MHFKHLRGQHDQRTHGTPGTGMGSGGYSSQLGQPSGGSSPQPRTDFLVKGKIPTELGKVDIDGLPSMKRVERGENGISRVEDAIEFVKNGGALRDVPDDFLLSALDDNSVANGGSRFEKRTVNASGVNGTPELYVDSTNGQGYFVKYRKSSSVPNEDVAEILGNNVAGRLGFPIGAVRIASDEVSYSQPLRRPVLLEHVSNAVEGVIIKPKNAAEALSIDDLVSATILDYIILNPDRHGGNYFFALQSDGAKTTRRFVPIDPSLGFDVHDVRRSQKLGAQTDEYAIRRFFRYGQGIRDDLIFKSTLLPNDPDDDDAPRSDEAMRSVSEAVERARIRLLDSEKRLPFAVAAFDALNAAGTPSVATARSPQGSRRPRESLLGGFDNFVDWPAQRIWTIISMDSEEFADLLMDQ